jgi:hypothetical protein
MRAVQHASPSAQQVTVSISIDHPGRMELPPSNGRAGGLARARSAIRAPDGTFLSHSEIEAVLAERSERHARGGRARAAWARRATDGTFLPGLAQ